MRFDSGSHSTDTIVLRQVASRAQALAVQGQLGTAVAGFLDALDSGARQAEREAFDALTAAHRAAIAACGNLAWCLERFAGDRDLALLGREVDASARRVREAHDALTAARRTERRWRAVARRAGRRPAAPARDEAAREYALAAMAFSRQVEGFGELLDARG